MRRYPIFLPVLIALPAGGAASAAEPAAAPALAAKAELVDALDFDNGPFLIEQSESYAPRTLQWSTWSLTDGSDENGWCTPKGKPLGASYAWELDTTWRLETLVLATTNLEESRHPGISAKTVELFVAAATGPWTSVGAFEVGKDERRSHALPADTRAARVKIVIVQNHGHAEYTELAEIDLLGRRVGPPPAVKIDGDYKTNFGRCASSPRATRCTGATTGPAADRWSGAPSPDGWRA